MGAESMQTVEEEGGDKKYVRATKSRKLYPPDRLKGQSHDLADRALS